MRGSALLVTGLGVSLALMLETPASAAFTCRAMPAALLAVGGDGNVVVHIHDGGINTVCNLNNTTDGVTPQVCASWYSTLLTFRVTSKTALLFYNGTGTNAGAQNCADFREWQTHVPYFFQLE